ncbi:MAG: GntR family transcriptional regulator [Pyrinomonadaceae bacterium]|nr:GntR family transcriptional regulator [Pyrinomonadaceae bacterium]
MRLWLSKSSEVPLREQLVTQIILGVVSNDLKANERLPSTRELARRYKIHANTVSAAFRELTRLGWVEFRKGSGVYVKPRAAEQPFDGNLQLDQLISKFFKTARQQQFSLADIQIGLRRWLTLQPPDHFLVIESDSELRSILRTELEKATGARVEGIGFDECTAEVLTGAVPVVMYSQADRARGSLPAGVDFVALHSQSVPASMHGEKSPPADALIGVVSRWPEFLRRARTILIAAGLHPDSLSVRDARAPGWQKGLRSTAFVITDSRMAGKIPEGCVVRVVPLISEVSIAELREYVGLFFK